MDTNLIHYIIHVIYGLVLAYFGYLKFIRKDKNDIEFQQMKTDIAILKNNEHTNACSKEHTQHTTEIAILKTKCFYFEEGLEKLDGKLDSILERL